MVFHILTNVVGITNLCSVASAFCKSQSLKGFVAHSLAYPYSVVCNLHIETCNHIFPVVIVGRGKNDALFVLVIWKKNVCIETFVSFEK